MGARRVAALGDRKDAGVGVDDGRQFGDRDLHHRVGGRHVGLGRGEDDVAALVAGVVRTVVMTVVFVVVTFVVVVMTLVIVILVRGMLRGAVRTVLERAVKITPRMRYRRSVEHGEQVAEHDARDDQPLRSPRSPVMMTELGTSHTPIVLTPNGTWVNSNRASARPQPVAARRIARVISRPR